MRNVLKNNAVFCLLARDCAEKLKGNIHIIEYYRGFFVASCVIVIENDSKDDTNNVLEDWKSKSDRIIISHVDSSDFNQKARIERMSICRNTYLDEIKKLVINPEYLILIDADLELKKIDIFSVIQNAPSDWTGLFANGQYYCSYFGKKIPVAYYDLFAYVPYDSDEYELNDNQMLDNGTRVDKLIKRNEYTKCNSAFGGIGIYRYWAVEDARYEAVNNTKSKMHLHLCEHIGFNRTCSLHGSLYICRSMKVLYERLSFKSCILVFLRKTLGAELQMKLVSFVSRRILRRGVKHS